MFERFTEKAIKVVTYAQEEALRAKHSKLYPEHLLIGILREGSSITARFLRASSLKIENLRDKIDEVIIIKQQESLTSDNLPFSPSIKKILKEAWDESRALGTNYISSEHLFLALLNDNNSAILNILNYFDVDIDRIKSSVTRVVEKKSKSSSHPEISPKSSSAILKHFAIPSIFEEKDSAQTMNIAREKLNESSLELLGTEHIFLAMLENSNSFLSNFLAAEGINQQEFIDKLRSIESREDEYIKNECLFTPAAFIILNSAYEYAKELGSPSIKPEHILLGLLKEKKGLAYRILDDLGVDTSNLYNKVLEPIEKQKPVTLAIIKLAKEEARRLGHNVIGTEQILLGLIGEGTGIAANVLKNLGITLKDARKEVEKLIGFGDGYSEKDMTFTPRVKKLLEYAWAQAKALNQPRIESEHLLLGIIKEKECMAMKILEIQGVDVLEIKQGIIQAIDEKRTNLSISQDEL